MSRDRDWVDIGGTAAVIAAVLLLVAGVIWVTDRNLARDDEAQLACIEQHWLWHEGQCTPWPDAVPTPTPSPEPKDG